ncbi:hypothetical protein PHMEG_00015077 [Phytophthora megakarya]|uniref:Uncharacterized protein n=1 Tax=Phytophthora megakarya TaxID=4795 RepID=A0A225W266_9STRA|nr:hypothetical protein PHMEG_00015077 [Phytophthora megakarya]
MSAVIKRHQEMYDRLDKRFQLALRSNAILTKEVNHGRSEYLVRIQAFKKSHENLHKLLCQTEPKETTLTYKLRERNRDLVRQVKRLEKANSALSSRLRLEDMDPEALVLIVEGFELDKIDWETLANDSQTRRALKAIYKIGLEDGRDQETLADDIARAKGRFAAGKQRKAKEAAAAAGFPAPPPLTVSVLIGGNFYAFANSFTFDHADWTSIVDCLSCPLSAYLHTSHSTDESVISVSSESESESSAQKYWVKLERAFLPSPVPSDTEIKWTTVAGFPHFPASRLPGAALWSWRRLRGYGNEKQAVISFAIYERKHWVSPEAVKRFLSRMSARLLTIKDPEEHRKFKLALERLKKVWFKYNKERADRADNLRTFLPGRMWPWCIGPDATLPSETLLGPTLPFYTIENLMWVPGSADWCAEVELMNNSELYRVDWLTCPEQHPYNTVYVPCNAHVPLFLPANSTVEALGPQIVPHSSLKAEDIDSSWDRAFRVADEDKEMEEGEVVEDDVDSTATMDLNQDSAGDPPVDPQDAAAEAALILLFVESSPPSTSGVVAEI